MARSSMEPPGGRPRGEGAARSKGRTSARTVAGNVATGNVIESSTLQPVSEPAEDRHEAIARAAYRRAEERGFAAGHELDDWLEAEREFLEGERARPTGIR